jgi:hypothetical protein|tara:strand:- start:12 stop:404 length:393 start_codon:yes stop_codon:yes gene_type:complete
MHRHAVEPPDDDAGFDPDDDSGFDPDDLENLWPAFMNEHGDDIQDWVADELEDTRGLFDCDDGTHIKWVDEDTVGFLICLSTSEVHDLLQAWEDAHNGSSDASGWLMKRCAKAFAMLEVACDIKDDPDEA